MAAEKPWVKPRRVVEDEFDDAPVVAKPTKPARGQAAPLGKKGVSTKTAKLLDDIADDPDAEQNGADEEATDVDADDPDLVQDNVEYEDGYGPNDGAAEEEEKEEEAGEEEQGEGEAGEEEEETAPPPPPPKKQAPKTPVSAPKAPQKQPAASARNMKPTAPPPAAAPVPKQTPRPVTGGTTKTPSAATPTKPRVVPDEVDKLVGPAARASLHDQPWAGCRWSVPTTPRSQGLRCACHPHQETSGQTCRD